MLEDAPKRRRPRLVLEIAVAVVILAALGIFLVTRGGSGINEELARELLRMEEADQDARNAAIEAGGVGSRGELTNEQRQAQAAVSRVDRENTARMREIVDRFGWPGKSLVGERAAASAWLLVQHADADPVFQKRVLTFLKGATEGEVDPSQIAYLEDRVDVADGKEQTYGTQFECRDGSLQPRTPIVEPDGVDARRMGVGLGPLEEYKDQLRATYGDC